MALDLTIKFAGEGGEGVISSGDFLMQAATRAGFDVVTFKSFPSEIKGGYAMSQVRISDQKLISQGDGFDIVVVFNGEAFEVNRSLMKPGTVVVYDGPEGSDFEADTDAEGVTFYAVPASKLAKDPEGLANYVVKNMVLMGSLIELFGVPESTIRSSIHDKFIRKGEAVVDLNYRAIEAGKNWIKTNYPTKSHDAELSFPEAREGKDVIILTGNQACAVGGTLAGAKFYGAYPITPATSVGDYSAYNMLKTNGYVYQTEDEIAAIATVIGASFAGVKSFTATSGPGIALMQELLGLAYMSEIPLVVIDVMRGGPSTGMPTKHDQSDLYAVALGGHGDNMRPVLAAANVSDCVYLTIDAFNLAEKYQTPVFMLSDASLSLQAEAIPTPDVAAIKAGLIDREVATGGEGFKRYLNTESGISPMGIPGIEGASYAATGLEHSEDSGPRTNPETRVAMTDKRWRKLAGFAADYESMRPTERIGEAGDEIGIIAWGMTQAIAKEAVLRLRAKGKKVSLLCPKLLWPVNVEVIEAFANSVGKVVIPEANVQGQYASLLKMQTSIKPVQINIYRGEPFIPAEIESAIEELLG
ncbi:MAG: 2-oxoacid:acceptor oxidoreductase subunit alpha [Alphaproteobacteria bacterium CG_4_10_14_0_2_um_filter_63_37]|nr:MAG: pyruvate ferredoxin oxidoreductase [Proteobacteria bacterium CG1_02_64_396]PJA25369.1 MAG: 2-oxoacid:acceptor oxidoreductase subunit alpha [Alphaproteobacteria bacterium CG_4_10_14_0_2_um_filter_63_37]